MSNNQGLVLCALGARTVDSRMELSNSPVMFDVVFMGISLFFFLAHPVKNSIRTININTQCFMELT